MMFYPGKIVEKLFVVICISVLFSITFWTMSRTDDNYIIYIDVQSMPFSVINKNFLSVGLDAVEISNGVSGLHLESPKLIQLASLLGPGYLRLGGTMSDRLIFVNQNSSNITSQPNKCNDTSCYEKFLPFFTMDSVDWLEINKFCNKTNLKLLFDLNVLLRKGRNWDSTNAIELFEFSRAHNLEIDWQLGNEPNSFEHVFNISLTPHQLSKDFISLRKLLKIYFPTSLLVGPDTTRPQPKRPSCVKYMKEFLMETSDYIDAIAWHQYYLNGHIATVEDFWNPDVMDLFQNQIDTMLENIMPYKKGLDMWLTETSSAYGGGAPGLSNTFSGSPLWLDKLGTAALNGLQVVIRQSILGANYSLIDRDLNPLPDWWLSFLFKSLVGESVISCIKTTSKFQRLYCHCASENLQQKRSITIYGINMEDHSIDLELAGTALNPLVDVDEFVLTALNGDRTSKHVLLNGVQLTYNEEFPKITPRQLFNVVSIRMPPYSLGFWVLHDVNMPFCEY